MNEKDLILEAMNKAGVPLNAGKIAELTGLDRKVVDKTMTAMKKDGNSVIRGMSYQDTENMRRRSAMALLLL